MKTVIVGEDTEHTSPANTGDSVAVCPYQIEVDRVKEAEWSELMSRFDDANIYQTWSYGAVRWQQKNLSHLVLKCDGEVVAMAQLRIMQPRNLRVGVAYLRWGPMCQLRGQGPDPEIVRTIAAALRHEYAQKRGLLLEIIPNAFSGSLRAEVFRSAFDDFEHPAAISTEQYRTFVLDLSPSLDELRKKLDKKWRNQLNAADRFSLNVVERDGVDDYRRFCTLYTEMWKRKKFHTEVSIGEFDQIQERLPETQRLRVLICEHEGKPVAGLVCSAIGESAIYLLGATNESGLKVKASYLLQWNMIQLLKERRIRFYDLGGIDPVANPGVYHFKSGFSGVDVSHITPVSVCDNPVSAGMVKTGQFLRRRLRSVQRRLARYGTMGAIR